MDGTGRDGFGCRPGNRLRQRPVDLERRRIPLEGVQLDAVALRQQLPVQGGRGDIGEHRAADPVARPVLRPDADGSVAADDDLRDAGVADQRPALRPEAPHQCSGELSGSADRHRPADLLAQHRHHPAHEPAARSIGKEVGVHRAAGQQQGGALAGERLLGHPPGGQGEEPQRLQGTGRPQPPGEADEGGRGRPRGEQQRHQLIAHGLPEPVQLVPRPCVRRTELVGEVLGGLRHRRVQSRAPAVEQRVRDHRPGPAPAQTVVLQGETAQDRGDGSQGVERTEQVRDERRVQHPVAADRAAGFGLGLKDHHLPSGVGQDVGGGQPVGAGSDDDGIKHGLGSRVLSCRPLLAFRGLGPIAQHRADAHKQCSGIGVTSRA